MPSLNIIIYLYDHSDHVFFAMHKIQFFLAEWSHNNNKIVHVLENMQNPYKIAVIKNFSNL